MTRLEGQLEEARLLRAHLARRQGVVAAFCSNHLGKGAAGLLEELLAARAGIAIRRRMDGI